MRRTGEISCCEAVEREEEITSQAGGQPLEDGKGEEANSPLELLEKNVALLTR